MEVNETISGVHYKEEEKVRYIPDTVSKPYSAASGNVMPLKDEERYSVYISMAVPLM